MKRLTLLAMIVATLLFASCSKKMIAGTKIEDTPQNHEILDVFYAYRQAMEKMDVENLEPLISKNYYDKNGTDVTTDDVDYEGIIKFLQSEEYQSLTKLHSTYVMKDLQIKSETEAVIFYFYELQARRKSNLPISEQELAVSKGGRWLKVADDMIMVLRKEGDKWLIVSGL
ncbi:hypothetical protein KAH37_06470 [bacterium]|nr:hypothetical protein [bacterium]